jgi:hypothetical protein
VDGAGAALRDHAFPDTDGGRRDVVRLLEVLARGERLKALPSGTGRARLSAKVSVELASHEDGKRIRRRRHGERLFSDEVISLRIRNQSPSELFVWLFDVGVTGDITLITNQSPSGWRLGPKGTTDDTYTAGGEAGTALEWRPDVPRDGPRPEAFVLVVADRRQDLGALETPKGLRGTRSGLDQALEEVRSGTREWGAATGAVDGALRYAVERVDFLLEAVPKPRIDEPAFEVDDTPDLSLRALQPRGAVEPPKAVAVRLAELAVRRNGALFSASIRVDSLVLTADKDGQVLANPTTMRFPNVADHDVLPLDNALLFHGDVNGFLDLALWVWRDDAKGRDLADLFATELGQQGTRDALRFVGGLVLAAPQVAVGVAAVSAVAGIVRMGAHLVAAATKREIGVYRTSKLAFESFGVGRMPPAGRKQAKDIEFAYEITEL